MAKKLIGRFGGGNVEAKMYRDSEWNEYTVRLFVAGREVTSDGGYHTDDKKDAKDTAEAMVKDWIAKHG